MIGGLVENGLYARLDREAVELFVADATTNTLDLAVVKMPAEQCSQPLQGVQHCWVIQMP
jgi:hypothetical protein